MEKFRCSVFHELSSINEIKDENYREQQEYQSRMYFAIIGDV